MPNFTAITEKMGVPPPSEITPLHPGTTARVWRLRCGEQDFLLRTLQNRAQGEKEARIALHLRKKAFSRTPEILGMAEAEGKFYQLQVYLAGTAPDPALPGMAGAIAATVKALSAALADCPPIFGVDRFDLQTVWAQNREHWDALGTGVPLREADAAVGRCAAISDGALRVIHGDLGPWNLRLDETGKVFVIDFGEARMGDPYFDLASALGGIINHSPDELRERVCLEYLQALEADSQRLLDQLRLWSWRGLAQCARAVEEGSDFTRFAGRFLNALRCAERLLGGEYDQL